MTFQIIADSWKEQSSRLRVLEDLAVDSLLQTDQLGPDDLVDGSRVLGQAVEHQRDQFGHVQDCKLAKQVRVNGTDVFKKDHLF